MKRTDCSIFAIGDLHLPGGDDKSMDVFGAHWEGHFEAIASDWQQRVAADDIVLIPGDISWAMKFEEAQPDLLAIAALPGRKILIRGNHDYWWGSISRLRAWLPPDMQAIQNDAVMLDGIVFAGTRGWTIPDENATVEDVKIFSREQVRLRLSLTHARRISPDGPLVALIHYPPMQMDGSPSEFTELFTQYGVSDVVYGHLHGTATAYAYRGEMGGVRYHPVSCDGLGFTLYQLPDVRGT